MRTRFYVQVWLALVIANVIYACFSGDFNAAAERSYFQFSAVLLCWLFRPQVKVLALAVSLIGLSACGAGPTSPSHVAVSTTPAGPGCTSVPPAESIRDASGDEYRFGPHHTVLRNLQVTVNGQDWSNLIGTTHGTYIVALGGASWVSTVPDVWVSAGYIGSVLTAEELHPAGCPVVSIGGQ